jgi:hypothetical protein
VRVSLASRASRSRRAAAFTGRKPSNTKRSLGRPATLNAAIAAHAPGTGDTRTPAARAALTRRKPGSLTSGVPASDTSASESPASRRATSCAACASSLCWCSASSGRSRPEVGQQLSCVPGVLGADGGDIAQRVERARRQVAKVAYRRRDDVKGAGSEHREEISGTVRILTGPPRKAAPMPLPMPSPVRQWPVALVLAASLLLATLAGCSSMQTTGGAPAGRGPRSEAMVQADALARQAMAQGGAERAQTDKQIETLLAALDNPTLQREAAELPAGDPLYNYAGRALLRRGLPLPRPFDRTAWKFNAGNRPPAESDGYRPPMKLAVLLPLSGNLATAAAPVRDGLLTGYYGETRRRPEVSFYDTSTGASAAYDRAVSEGNDFVVGPLGRDEVGTLFNRAALPVPVLALNRSQLQPPVGNASFSLSPEDEGIAAADYLTERGARRVLVVSAEDETQRRAVTSLRERLAERGGTITDVVSEGAADFAPFAAKEGGVDAVFLAVRGTAARQLMPRLALAGLAGKPRVATSQLLSGTASPRTIACSTASSSPAKAGPRAGRGAFRRLRAPRRCCRMRKVRRRACSPSVSTLGSSPPTSSTWPPRPKASMAPPASCASTGSATYNARRPGRPSAAVSRVPLADAARR